MNWFKRLLGRSGDEEIEDLSDRVVNQRDEAMEKANDTLYGLTAGFFGEESDWFFENIQAGTTYVNRAAGATTGAWPGVQVFGGWKGSGSSGKGIGGLYTLALYMHEQSRTVIG